VSANDDTAKKKRLVPRAFRPDRNWMIARIMTPNGLEGRERCDVVMLGSNSNESFIAYWDRALEMMPAGWRWEGPSSLKRLSALIGLITGPFEPQLTLLSSRRPNLTQGILEALPSRIVSKHGLNIWQSLTTVRGAA